MNGRAKGSSAFWAIRMVKPKRLMVKSERLMVKPEHLMAQLKRQWPSPRTNGQAQASHGVTFFHGTLGGPEFSRTKIHGANHWGLSSRPWEACSWRPMGSSHGNHIFPRTMGGPEFLAPRSAALPHGRLPWLFHGRAAATEKGARRRPFPSHQKKAIGAAALMQMQVKTQAATAAYSRNSRIVAP